MFDKYEYKHESDHMYCYPNTNILINKLNIKNDTALHNAEMEIVAYQTAGLLEKPTKGDFDFKHLKAIHKRLFGQIYEWAGAPRMVAISKGSLFCLPQHIESSADRLFGELSLNHFYITNRYDETLELLTKFFADINALHPFREGNGRSQREFIEELAKINGVDLDLTVVDRMDMIKASRESINGDYAKLRTMFKNCSQKMSLEEQIKSIQIYCSKALAKDLIEELKEKQQDSKI